MQRLKTFSAKFWKIGITFEQEAGKRRALAVWAQAEENYVSEHL